jgi:hypothetical protein
MPALLRLKRVLPFVTFALVSAVLLVWVPLLFGCDTLSGRGACYEYSPPLDDCYQNYDKADCDIYGGSMTFAAGKSCADVGFDYWCSVGSSGFWTTSYSECLKGRP